MQTIETLLSSLPQTGSVRWIGVRPDKGASMVEPDAVQLTAKSGIIGDRYQGRSGTRQVTLIQFEHLAVVASVMGLENLPPALLRRNIAVSGINLLALKNQRFSIGATQLEWTGLCHPCTKMETILGPGGYNALRGHGGITARVVEEGVIRIGDQVALIGGSEERD